MKLNAFLFILITLLYSCNNSVSKLEEVKKKYLINKSQFQKTVECLNNLISKSSVLSNSENIFLTKSGNVFSSVDLILNKSESEFLSNNNIVEVHIYNKSKCDYNQIEFRTFSFETDNEVILQYDGCTNLAPKFAGKKFENSRAFYMKADRNWTVYIEK